ncbi:hypothetical protein Pmani_009240 [Petrolisthes manimaculis]|uniref:Uncharacterized protein n=1 Tax=Petrolisthes manimaculis TaxID=1843537 RepID=A0AAE1Q4P4_9EUCA|nr:hypothetical protein Pmani_009240 [Petrolisthes manimaculis]
MQHLRSSDATKYFPAYVNHGNAVLIQGHYPNTPNLDPPSISNNNPSIQNIPTTLHDPFTANHNRPPISTVSHFPRPSSENQIPPPTQSNPPLVRQTQPLNTGIFLSTSTHSPEVLHHQYIPTKPDSNPDTAFIRYSPLYSENQDSKRTNSKILSPGTLSYLASYLAHSKSQQQLQEQRQTLQHQLQEQYIQKQMQKIEEQQQQLEEQKQHLILQQHNNDNKKMGAPAHIQHDRENYHRQGTTHKPVQEHGDYVITHKKFHSGEDLIQPRTTLVLSEDDNVQSTSIDEHEDREKNTEDTRNKFGQIGAHSTTSADMADILTNLQILTVLTNQGVSDDNKSDNKLHYVAALNGASNTRSNENLVRLLPSVSITGSQHKPHKEKKKVGMNEGFQDGNSYHHLPPNQGVPTQPINYQNMYPISPFDSRYQTSIFQIQARTPMSDPQTSVPIPGQFPFSATSADSLPNTSNSHSPSYIQTSLQPTPLKEDPHNPASSQDDTIFHSPPAEASVTEATDPLGFNIFITPVLPTQTSSLAHVSNSTNSLPTDPFPGHNPASNFRPVQSIGSVPQLTHSLGSNPGHSSAGSDNHPAGSSSSHPQSAHSLSSNSHQVHNLHSLHETHNPGLNIHSVNSPESNPLRAPSNSWNPSADDLGVRHIYPDSPSYVLAQYPAPSLSDVPSVDLNKVMHQFSHKPYSPQDSPAVLTAPIRPRLPEYISNPPASPVAQAAPIPPGLSEFPSELLPNFDRLTALSKYLDGLKNIDGSASSSHSQEAVLAALLLSPPLSPPNILSQDHTLPHNIPYIPVLHRDQFDSPAPPALPPSSALPPATVIRSDSGVGTPQDCLQNSVCAIFASWVFATATTFAFAIPVLAPFLGRRRKRSLSQTYSLPASLEKGTTSDYFQEMLKWSGGSDPQVLEAASVIQNFLKEHHRQLLAVTLNKVPQPLPAHLLMHLTHGNLELLLATLRDLMATRHSNTVHKKTSSSRADTKSHNSTQHPSSSPNLDNSLQLPHQPHPPQLSAPIPPPHFQVSPHTTLQQSGGSDMKEWDGVHGVGQGWERTDQRWKGTDKWMVQFYKQMCQAVIKPGIPYTDAIFFIAQQCLLLAHTGYLY